ncbi:MAG: MFS transporter [Peptococcaceae bacterium]|nr:MFS transporter [Peptococcaceae bacterium]
MNQEQPKSLKKYALIAITTASFLTPFMGSAINLAVPSIGQEFNSGAILLSWVVSSYLLSTAAFLLPFGRLADIVGRKRVFVLGVSVFSLSSLLCGLAWSIEALIAFRTVQGIGGAMIFSTAMAILTSVFPPHERGKVLGINVATVYTGLSLGPVLGGAMNQHLGWQSIFYFNVLMGVLIVPLTLLKLKGEWAGARGEHFDLTGAALYSAGLVAFLYGFSSIATEAAARFILAAGLGLLALFIRREMHLEQPILDIKLFSRNATFAFSNLAALINYSATFAVGFLLSLYLQVVAGYDSQTAGLILLAQPVIMALLSPFAGTLSDRVEPRLVASWGMGLTTLGLAVFSFAGRGTPVWLIMANLALLGTGFALFSSPNSNAVMGSVDKRFYGVASSALGTMRLVGQALSMAVATLVIDLYLGSAQLTPANAPLLMRSLKTSFIIFAATCFCGVFASLARGNVNASLREPEKN